MPGRRIVTVALVDDHDLARHATRAALAAADDGIRIVGESRGATHAALVAGLGRPDVVLVDPQLREGNGIEACRRIQDAHPRVQLLVATALAGARLVLVASLVGAVQAVRKDCPYPLLADAIRRAAAGGRSCQIYVDAAVAALRSEQVPVSEADRYLLHLFAQGLADDQVAARSGLARPELAARVTAIAETCGLRCRAHTVLVRSRHANRPARSD